MDQDLADLTEAERAWVRHSEQLWAQAHRIAQAPPGAPPRPLRDTWRRSSKESSNLLPVLPLTDVLGDDWRNSNGEPADVEVLALEPTWTTERNLGPRCPNPRQYK
jgi:hypothetical protein